MADNNKLYRGDGESFPLDKKNLILMAVAFGAIVIGFLLMLGSPSTAEEFNPGIYSFRRIVAGPFVSLAGFVFMAYAIISGGKKRKNKENADGGRKNA